ncbi:hypothetical protein HAALTHF_27020n [Vreelandella aquamarina]|nr:hypothetical protein HAALTHF_27020n [Halomonas axialensis]
MGEDDRLYNVAYLFHRDGEVEKQSKLHITPQERRDWVIEGGDDLQVFDTDAGRVGILICYDVEFPELGRLLADQDMDILFVPFWVDTKMATCVCDTALRRGLSRTSATWSSAEASATCRPSRTWISSMPSRRYSPPPTLPSP